MDETDQELNKSEEKSFIPFDIELQTRQKLEDDFLSNKSYKTNQDLLLISLYSLIPVMRDELKLLEFTTTKNDDGDQIYFKGNDIILDLNNPKKQHEGIQFIITNEAPHLADIIHTSYNLFHRQFVFMIHYDTEEKAKVQNLSRRMNKIFSFTNKNVGVNSLRSSYASYLDQNRMTVKEKDELAKKMRTSRRYLDLNYIKILPNTQAQMQNPAAAIATVELKPEQLNAYQKQLLRNNDYYE